MKRLGLKPAVIVVFLQWAPPSKGNSKMRWTRLAQLYDISIKLHFLTERKYRCLILKMFSFMFCSIFGRIRTTEFLKFRTQEHFCCNCALRSFPSINCTHQSIILWKVNHWNLRFLKFTIFPHHSKAFAWFLMLRFLERHIFKGSVKPWGLGVC